MADYKILTIPFARDAVPDMVNDIPNDPSIAEPQLASFKQGFPSITTIPLVAGGIPPEGQDFNGILRDITEHVVHQNKGGMYKFAPEVVAAGGYPKGAVLSANDGLSLWVSLQDNNVQDFNSGTPTQWARIAFSGLDALLVTKADKAVSINAGTGLTGGGDLSANRTLSVSYGTAAGTAAQGDDSRITGAAQKSANLSDLASPVAARTNLGLDALLNSKLDNSSVVQATGASTNNVMSQKAVTDALAGVDKFNATIATIASASTVNLTTGAPNTSQITITGTTSISAFTVAAGRAFVVKFSGNCTLVNGASLVTGTGGNIAVTAGSTCIIRATAANVVEVAGYVESSLIGTKVTAFAKTLLDDADAAAAKATLQITEPLGVGQAWHNLTASRAAGTTYTNTTGKPIYVAIWSSVDDGYSQLTVDWITVSTNGNVPGSVGDNRHSVAAIVPNGSTYSYAGSTINTWAELR